MKTMKTMKIPTVLLTCVLAIIASNASAELQPWEDYDFGDTIMTVTTVKVDANMLDLYLEGLKQTWVASNNVAKELGHIRDFHIYGSDLPGSGDFNLMLVVTFNSAEDLEPSKERYQQFMQRWGEKNEERNREIAKTYPDVRTITGAYRMREINIK